MHEHGCLHFRIQNKNLYKTEQKKVNNNNNNIFACYKSYNFTHCLQIPKKKQP
jgi:hypothetical protein